MTEYFADVFRHIPAVGVPSAVLADGQGARGDGVGGIPCEQPQARVIGAGEVAGGNLQVTSVDIALMERDAIIDGHLLGGATTQGIVVALDDDTAISTGETNGTVFRVVDYAPGIRRCLDQRLVAIRIEDGDKCRVLILLNGCVLVERISFVECVIDCLHGHSPISDIVVIVAVGGTVHRGTCQFGARVVHEAVIHSLTVAGGAAGDRATERVVAVGTLRHKSSTSVIGHAGEQISLNFTAFPNRHA